MDPYTALVAVAVILVFAAMEIYDMKYNDENSAGTGELPGNPDPDKSDDDVEEVRIQKIK